jgi:hypothetical protein
VSNDILLGDFLEEDMAATTRSRSSASAIETRVNRLSAAALRRVIEPDEEVPGSVGDGQILPDELLCLPDDALARLTPEQKKTFAREAIASVVQSGIRFEAVLEAGFTAQLATAHDRELADPRYTFILHEVGEETRHQRLFQRLLSQLDPKAKQAIPMPLVRFGYGVVTHTVIQSPALLYALILGGEEIPDLFQKLASEHPDTDPFVRAVNRYHRQEEARHLSFARAVYPEVWERATRVDRFLVKRVAPKIIDFMFSFMFQPGIYATVDLPTFPTWHAALQSPRWVQLRWTATRPVLGALVDAGAISARHVPAGWRKLCGLDREGQPLPPVAEIGRDARVSRADVDGAAVGQKG